MTERKDTEHWMIEKKIPLPMLLAIGLQTSAFVWWAATTSARVDQLEKGAVTAAPQAERLVRLETKFDMLAATMVEIKEMLRRPSTTGARP